MQDLIDKALGREARAGRITFTRDAIQHIPGKVRKDIIATAEKEAEGGFPYLPLSLYRDFSITGSRDGYQKPYFQKRKLLSDLVIAEAIEGKRRFIPLIEDGIWSLLSEPVWTIPAHNTYIRDAEQPDTPLIERPILDLFQCETGEILSLTASILSDSLSPILRQDIEHALRTRILEPYITDHFWWMGNDGPLNNWAPWCTQNVLLSVLTLPLSEKEARKVLKTAVSTLDQYISSFPEDGGCDEGASYYHAAALALWGALHVIALSTGCDMRDVFANGKIKAMAEYIEKVHVSGDIYLNFADCSPKAGHLTAREYLFGKAVGSQALMHHAALDADNDWRESDNDYNLFYKYIALSSWDEIREEAARKIDIEKPRFTMFSGTGLAIYRQDGITFAIKGGHNGESHNHNDAGSIILYKGKKPCLIDIGVETYTKTTFSKDRYTLLPMRSSYHNVVNFPPLEQHEGEEYMAETLMMSEKGVSFDLTGAYESGKGLRKYARNVSFEKGIISIAEIFDSDNPAVLSLLSTEKPVIRSRSVRWESFKASFSGKITGSVETIEITDARLRITWPKRIYRALITLPGPISWTIGFKEEDNG